MIISDNRKFLIRFIYIFIFSLNEYSYETGKQNVD